MTSSVTLDALRVSLGGADVLDGLDLSVEAGEFVTLLGASGSGKSTVLNAIAGLVPIAGGRIRFDDREVQALAARARRVGMVFQSYALFPHLTVQENVAFPLVAARRPAAERREVTARMLALVELEGFEERRPDELSGGQRQRVAVARALAASPDVLLLDEPLAALDKRLRDQMQAELREVHRRTGLTTIAVTHDRQEAFAMSDRIAVLEAGRISQLGTPEELYRRPASRSVALLLGEANLLPVDARGAVVDVLIDGAVGSAAGSGAGPAQAGAAVSSTGDGLLIVRPEDLRPLGAATGAGAVEEVQNGRAAFLARITALSFQGDRLRIEALTAAGRPLVSSVPTDADIAGLALGAEFVFALPAEAAQHRVRG